MKKVAILFSLALGWAPIGFTAEPNLAGNAAAGKPQTAACAACHGPDGNTLADHKLGNLRARLDLAATVAYLKNPKAPMPKMYPDLLDEKSLIDVATWVHEELP